MTREASTGAVSTDMPLNDPALDRLEFKLRRFVSEEPE
jgi:hypothetical protein